MINDLLIQTNYIIGLDGINISKELDVDENDVNRALVLIQKGTLGKGNHYNNELSMAMYFDKLEKMTSSKNLSDLFLAYANFLVVDGIAKYILYRVRQNGDLDKNLALAYGEKLRTLNEYVRTYGPMDGLEDCIEEYFELCYMILKQVGMEMYGCA
jgi:hypothetical protein